MWDLSESSATVESLRGYLREYACDAYAELDGLYLKAWFGDAGRGIWGAVYIWDRQDQMSEISTVSRAIDLIGYPPTSVGGFELEAAVHGRSVNTVLSGLGLAFEGSSRTRV